MIEPEFGSGALLNELLQGAGLESLDPETTRRFESYLSLIDRWNSRTNLTSIRDVEGIIRRHFIESITCARALPSGIRTLLDFGSGAGFPGLPIALCRPEIAVTLAESQGKKAAFLNEAVRVLNVNALVHAARAEELGCEFDCVALRAVDRMAEAVAAAARLVKGSGWLVLLITREQRSELRAAAGMEFSWECARALPGVTDRIVALGRKSGSVGE